MTKNVTPPEVEISRDDRAKKYGHRGAVVWLTGLSGSGKSTIAARLERLLLESNHVAYMVDGDVVRQGLNRDLGFSEEDRRESVRRVGEVAWLLMDAGALVIASMISPYKNDREKVRTRVGADRFIEVHVATPLETCEERDPKGLYAKARAGKISDFTGVSSPYEAPESPDVIVRTDEQHVNECVDTILAHLVSKNLISELRR